MPENVTVEEKEATRPCEDTVTVQKMHDGVNEAATHMITQEKWVESIIKATATRPQIPKSPRIQRVPKMLKNMKSKCNFEPMLVSIGPYHCENKELRQMQPLKHRITSLFVTDDQQVLEELYNKLLFKVKKLRECYANNSTDDYGDEEFTRMMLVDGCFILYFIHCIVEQKTSKLEMKSHQLALVQQDLFLLENQLPFLVLKKLMKNSRICQEGYTTEMTNKFMRHIIMAPEGVQPEGKKVHTICLLDLLHQRLVGGKAAPSSGISRSTFRSIAELRAVGIHFKNSGSRRVTEIDYSSGKLKLPQITVDDSTKVKYLNLIAYEMCPDAPDDLWVTSYICFLDSLIDHPNDVKELRSANILENCLGSDEEVAKLFNDIGTGLVPHPLAYAKVKTNIQEHYMNTCKTWRAQFKHKYFHNPWSALALAGALLALFLSGLQVGFQIWLFFFC